VLACGSLLAKFSSLAQTYSYATAFDLFSVRRKCCALELFYPIHFDVASNCRWAAHHRSEKHLVVLRVSDEVHSQVCTSHRQQIYYFRTKIVLSSWYLREAIQLHIFWGRVLYLNGKWHSLLCSSIQHWNHLNFNTKSRKRFQATWRGLNLKAAITCNILRNMLAGDETYCLFPCSPYITSGCDVRFGISFGRTLVILSAMLFGKQLC